ncbi:MAG: sulfatase [Planctomycetota bacterium]
MRFVAFLLVSIVTAACARSESPPEERNGSAERPNIVFLLADDLGWTGLRSFGSDLYETPHLDALAESGVKFTNAYAACTVCSPTRASIMTGMYPARLRLTDFIAGQNRPYAQLEIPNWTKRLEHKYVTVAEALGEAGYRTAHVGKWHLNGTGEKDGDPVDHGFDTQVLKPPKTKGYFLPEGFNRDGESGSDYLTDYLTDKALKIIDQSGDTPFFLYFAYHTPHTPIQGRADLVEHYRRKVRDDAVHNNPKFAAMVGSLDQSVGRILARLKDRDLEKRTIVIFTSDNGGLTQRYGRRDLFTENTPLRRGKGSAYEGGVRVPAIIRWPGVTTRGTVCDEPIISSDYYPTILRMAGVKGNPEHNKAVDGVDLTTLFHQPDSSLKRDLFWHYPHYHAGGDSPYSAIRSGHYRLIEFHEDQGVRLYNLANDLRESDDLSEQLPDQTAKLRTRLHQWRESLDAQMPTPNPNHDPSRATKVQKQKSQR